MREQVAVGQALTRELRLKDLKFHDSGGTGLIYVFTTATKDQQVVKVLQPGISNKKTIRAFLTESQQLINISSPNIIKGIRLGKVRYEKTVLPYLIMEYFPHENLDLQKTEVWKKGWDFVLSIIKQMLKALSALHEKNICHLDVKERNVLLDYDNGIVKLLDLGSARSSSELSGDTTVTGTFLYWPNTWQSELRSSRYVIAHTSIVLPRAKLNPDVDMHMLSVTLANILKSAPAHLQDTSSFKRLELFVERMNWDNRVSTTNAERYLTASQALKDWYKVEATRSLPSTLQSEGLIRLPILSVTHFNDSIREIISLPWVLRLKSVLQLATTHLVYPSAKHDRYEHSLGVYENSLRYLEALFNNKNSVWPSILLDPEDCIFLALAALLHDLGHYPFAHQVEELEKAPSPDLISYVLLAGKKCPRGLKKEYGAILSSERLKSKYGDPSTIGATIARQFGIDYSRFLKFFAYCYGESFGEDMVPKFRQGSPRKWALLADIVTGPIDADKFDYIQRDSWHCGTKFGRDMDAERFLISLIPEIGEPIRLAVTDKGRTTVEQLLDSRYQMFSEVYWHHTVRAFTAMIRQLLQVAFESHLLTVEDLLLCSEREIVELIMNKCQQAKELPHNTCKAVLHIGKAVLERRPYLRLWTISSEGSDSEIYSKMTQQRHKFYADSFEWSSVLKQYFGGITAQGDLIWDIPKPGKDKIGDITILTRDGQSLSLSSRLKTLSENFESSVRKIRLFIEPKYRAQLQGLKQRTLVEEIRRELKDELGIR